MKWQLRDVKVIRRAEIGSAHYLLLMIIMLKLKREKPRESRTGSGSIRVKKLRNKDVRWKFEARLRSRYRVDRQIGDQDIEAACMGRVERRELEISYGSLWKGKDKN